PSLKYVGEDLGTSIQQLLRGHAYDMAIQYVHGKSKTYVPWMGPTAIASALEDGGFEFNSLSPGREVNAALINLKGIKKKPSQYAVEDADEILEDVRTW